LKLELSCAKRRIARPSLPKNKDGKVLIHIGCGKTNSPEFINIDARPLAHVHIATDDITSLSDFETGTVDMVYMCHILEHIKGLSVPDFDRLVEVYDTCGKDINTISRQLMGGQDHEYNVHYSVFNHGRLSELLKEVGFREIVPWDPDNCEHHDFKDRASRRIKIGGGDVMISLNLEAIK